MDESILRTTKKLLGLDNNYAAFDEDVIQAINSALFSLMQMGIGPAEGFSIRNDVAIWEDFLEDASDLEGVKQYVYLKARYVVDPPSTAYLLDAIQSQTRELEWRLVTQIENARGG